MIPFIECAVCIVSVAVVGREEVLRLLLLAFDPNSRFLF